MENGPFDLLGQWLNFKLFGITYVVGKISRSNLFFQGPLAKWVVLESCHKKQCFQSGMFQWWKGFKRKSSTRLVSNFYNLPFQVHDGKLIGWQNLLCLWGVLAAFSGFSEGFLGLYGVFLGLSSRIYLDPCHDFCPVSHCNIQAVILTDDTSSACFSVGVTHDRFSTSGLCGASR